MLPDSRAVNQTVKSRLEGTGPHVDVPQSNWIREFAALPNAAAHAAFGSAGHVLHGFLSQMDIAHPDFERCLSEKLFNGTPSPTFTSVVGLVSLAVEKGRFDLLDSLPSFKLLNEMQCAPKQFIRCMSSPQDREEARQQKKPQFIDMTTVARKGEELWSSQPSSFESLIRYEEAYAAEIAAATRRAKRFYDLGCSAMYSEIMKTVATFQSQVSDSYVGFNRLTFNAACVILAKWHGYELIAPYILSDFPPERNYRVTVGSKRFRNVFSFFLKPEDADLAWPYSPRVYPVQALEPLPVDVVEIIGLAENYHGFGGRPLFDHYAVMVPGIEYPPQREQKYCFLDEQGKVCEFVDQNLARLALDKKLLDAGAFSAVVMGERDGKCYFLCLWG